MSLKRTAYRASSEDLTNKRLVDRFTELFPATKGGKVVGSAQPEMIGAVCNLAKSAFDAHRNPDVIGFEEGTTSMATIKHLTRQSVMNAMEGILRIDVKDANHLKEANWEAGDRCDPYVIFKHGTSIVKSTAIYGTVHPIWNSRHYLCIRKDHIQHKPDASLTAVVFCRDANEFKDSVDDAIADGNHLGLASIPIDSCKQPGVQEFKLELRHKSLQRSKAATIEFSVEFLSVEDALEELEKGEGSDVWMEPLESVERSHQWCQLACMTEVGDIELEQISHISSASKLTKAWIELNKDLKMVVVSFNGGGFEELPRLLGEDFQPEPLKSSMQSQWAYVLRPRRPLRHDGIRLHRAFKSAYDTIRESILTVVYDITHWQHDWTICVTGHSIGGALATICAFDLGNRKLNLQTGSPKSYMTAAKERFHRVDTAIKPQLAMINFGAPRVGNGVFARLYDLNILRSLRVVTSKDPVPHLPMQYVHTRTEVEFDSVGEVKISSRMTESREKSEKARMLLGITPTSPMRRVVPRGLPTDCGLTPVNEDSDKQYFEVAHTIAKRYYWKDVESRGHPLRILRS